MKTINAIITAFAITAGLAPAAQAQQAPAMPTLSDIAMRDTAALVTATHFLQDQGLEIVVPLLAVPKGFGANHTTYHFTFVAKKADGTLVEASIKCKSGEECNNWPKSFEALQGEELKAAADQALALHKAAEAEFTSNGQTIMSLRGTNDKVASYIVRLPNGTLDLTAIKK